MLNRTFDSAVTSFSEQFEPDGEAFVFRSRRRGAAIPVSAVEREAFVADFRRSFIWLTWGYTGALMAVLVLLAIFVPALLDESNQLWIFGVVIASVIPVLIVNHLLWDAPLRQLGRRPTVGKERSRSEAKRLFLSELGWGQLLASWAFIPITFIFSSSRWDIWHGWGRLWLVFIGVVAGVLLYQMFRKWQIGAGGD